MASCKARFRPATRSDAVAWYSGSIPATFRGYVAEIDGEVVGIGGVFYVSGYPVAFSEMKTWKRLDKKSIACAIRFMIDFFDKEYKTVYAFPSKDEPGARRLLLKLGFVFCGSDPNFGDVMVRVV